MRTHVLWPFTVYSLAHQSCTGYLIYLMCCTFLQRCTAYWVNKSINRKILGFIRSNSSHVEALADKALNFKHFQTIPQLFIQTNKDSNQSPSCFTELYFTLKPRSQRFYKIFHSNEKEQTCSKEESSKNLLISSKLLRLICHFK